MEEDRMLSDEILLALIKKNSGGGGSGGSGLEIKTYEYTGDGATQHTINLDDADAKFVLSLRRKDGLIFVDPFSMNATKGFVHWTTPNFGQNFIDLSVENSAITVNGVDAGQTLNSNGIDYVVEYLAGSASGSGSDGAKFRSKKYVGTGTTSHTIDFGGETA